MLQLVIFENGNFKNDKLIYVKLKLLSLTLVMECLEWDLSSFQILIKNDNFDIKNITKLEITVSTLKLF